MTAWNGSPRLQVGDKVKLVGEQWDDWGARDMIVTVDEVRNGGKQPWSHDKGSTGKKVASLADWDGDPFEGFAIELVFPEPDDVDDSQKAPETLTLKADRRTYIRFSALGTKKAHLYIKAREYTRGEHSLSLTAEDIDDLIVTLTYMKMHLDT